MGNFLCGDVEPSAALGRLAPFVRYVHAKDFIVKEGAGARPGRGFFRSRGGRYLRGTIIGHGDVPVAACLGILKEAGYAGAWASSSRGWRTAWRASPSGWKTCAAISHKSEQFQKRPLSREG